MVEERVTVLETEFRTELRHLATKEDLQALENRIVRWMLGVLLSSIAVATTLAVFIQRLTD